MCPASYNLWARLMVREGARPRRELAVCCRVEVIKGARGTLVTFVSLTFVICQESVLAVFKIFSTSSFFVGSFEQTKAKLFLVLSSRWAVMVQKVIGRNARISRSRSMMMRRAGDCTLPAERP